MPPRFAPAGVCLRAARGVIAGLALAACASGGRGRSERDAASAATAGGWHALVTGPSLDAWRGYRGAPIPAGWTVVDGVLARHVSTGDLVTRAEFGDFELEWEWRIGTRGDAGVFYRGSEEGPRLYWSGVEYQLEDDANPVDGPSRLAGSGAVYGLYPAPAGVVRPTGEWNRSRIVARGAHVEHWLNGEKVAEYEVGSAEWEAKVRGSKFAQWPLFARARRGHIAIQGDHDGELAIRAMRIREWP